MKRSIRQPRPSTPDQSKSNPKGKREKKKKTHHHLGASTPFIVSAKKIISVLNANPKSNPELVK